MRHPLLRAGLGLALTSTLFLANTASAQCPELGPIGYPAQGGYLGQSYVGPHEFADDTQRAIDLEVGRLVREAEERALGILRDHRAGLDSILELLLVEETVSGSQVYQLLGQEADGLDGGSSGY